MGEHRTELDLTTILAASRTHLANERTFAAWIRTGLSVAAGGIVVTRSAPHGLSEGGATLALGVAFILLGGAMIVFGGIRFGWVAKNLTLVGSPSTRFASFLVYAVMALLSFLLAAAFLVLR